MSTLTPSSSVLIVSIRARKEESMPVTSDDEDDDDNAGGDQEDFLKPIKIQSFVAAQPTWSYTKM
jgi:hypothetical protein